MRSPTRHGAALSGLMLLSLIAPVRGADTPGLPPPVVPQGFGVNIHFTDPQPGEMQRFAEAGYRLARMDLTWGRVEREAGQYDFSAFDRLTDHLARAGARPLYILDYGNRLYDDGLAPHTPEGRGAFARYAAAGAERYRGRGVLWEIWNEPNLAQFWKPVPDADAYAELALATAKAVRAADPDALILAPGTSGFPWAFFETIFAAGLLEHIDAVSVHPYRSSAPETAAADYARLRGLIARYAPVARRDLPIVSSEWGYTTSTGPNSVTEDQQARYLARQWLANLASGVNLSIFYDWKDDGPDPTEREHRFGTVQQDLTPKPAFLAAKSLIEWLSGFAYRHRLQGEDEHDWRLLFQSEADPDALAVVYWTSDPGAPDRAQTPAIRNVGPNDPDFVDLRRLASIHYSAGPRAESSDWPAALDLVVVNEEPRPAAVTLALGEEEEVAFRAAIPGGGRESRRVEVPLSASRAEGRTVPIRLLWNNEPLPEVVPLDLRRADPLSLEVAPAGPELVVMLDSPSGRPFSGRLRLLAEGREQGAADVRLEEGATRETIRLPRPDGGHRLALIDAAGGLAAAVEPRRYVPLAGFPTAPAEESGYRSVLFVENAPQPLRPLSAVATPDGSPAPVALAFRYEFEPGWRYATAAPAARAEIPPGARSLVLWVHADGSGDQLRSRFRDATGQTFQVDLGHLDWEGWRPVSISLDGTAAGIHWGGANDGVPHAPLAWEALVLIDSARREAPTREGEVLLAAPSYVLAD